MLRLPLFLCAFASRVACAAVLTPLPLFPSLSLCVFLITYLCIRCRSVPPSPSPLPSLPLSPQVALLNKYIAKAEQGDRLGIMSAVCTGKGCVRGPLTLQQQS